MTYRAELNQLTAPPPSVARAPSATAVVGDAADMALDPGAGLPAVMVAQAPAWLTRIRQPETILLLLSALLVLAGTLYLAAATWTAVPGALQPLYLQGVVLGCAAILLVGARSLSGRLELQLAHAAVARTATAVGILSAALAAGLPLPMMLAGAGFAAAFTGFAARGLPAAKTRAAWALAAATFLIPLVGLLGPLGAAAAGIGVFAATAGIPTWLAALPAFATALIIPPTGTAGSLLVLASSSWEVLSFASPLPALVLAALAVCAVLAGVHWRLRGMSGWACRSWRLTCWPTSPAGACRTGSSPAPWRLSRACCSL